MSQRDDVITKASEAPATLPRWRVGTVLFVLSLGVYAVTRLVGLDRFPIYFFSDEAIQGVLAARLLEHGFRDYQDHLLPFFFNSFGLFVPLITVYWHVAGLVLFGKSMVVTRAVPALVTIVGAAAVSLSLKEVFKVRYWWAAVLVLAATPSWFLHSRTAFESAMMVSFYACFLLSYLLYRYRSPRFLYAALVFAALTFYSYANGQLVIGVTGILLAISDLRYHCRQWRTALPAGVVVALMAMPSVLFYQQHPAEAAYHLRILDSYVVRDLTLSDKIGQFIDTYRYGVSPQYWFVPNDYELARQRMKDYGHIAIWMLPLFVIGVGLCLRHIASSAHRVVLIALLAAPVGGALTAIGITRVLAFVVPAAMAITLGLDWVLGHARNRRMQLIAPVLVFLILSAASLAMFRDALTNGPLWFRNYGLYGMQWGAQQIFAIIRQYLQQSPQTRVYLTPTWANGTDAFRDYFTPDDPRVQMETVDGLMDAKHALDDSMVFVVTPDEYRRARASGKFKDLRMERTLKYPDGSDGFYFVRIQYVDNIDQILADEKAARLKPVEENINIDGQTATVVHSRFDIGQLKDLFDGDTFTLARVREANPAILEFTFQRPRSIKHIAVDVGSMNFVLKISLATPASADAKVYTQTFSNMRADPHVEMSLPDAPSPASHVRVEVEALGVGEGFKIHIRELALK